MFKLHRLPILGAVLAGALLLATPAHAEKVRIGYWSSGVSLGFGALLENGKFMEKEGLEVEYIKFPDVNAPTKAMAANAIDFAIGASAGSALSVTADGLPMSIVLATQVAALKFVVPMDSPIKSLAELKGKKIGMSPPGSATAAITAAILESNHGLKGSDYTAVPGNDPRLAQFLVQKDIDAAALRTVTLAQLTEVKFREIGDFRSEWKAMTRQDASPVLGVGLARNAWLAAQPEAAAKVIAAMRKAYEYGKTNKPAIAEALVSAANMKPEDAKAYAQLWDGIYTVSMEPADIASLRRQFDVFKGVGAVKGTLPEKAFASAAYQQSKQIR